METWQFICRPGCYDVVGLARAASGTPAAGSSYDDSTAPSGFFYRGKAIDDTAAALANSQHTVIFNSIGDFERRFAGLLALEMNPRESP